MAHLSQRHKNKISTQGLCWRWRIFFLKIIHLLNYPINRKQTYNFRLIVIDLFNKKCGLLFFCRFDFILKNSAVAALCVLCISIKPIIWNDWFRIEIIDRVHHSRNKRKLHTKIIFRTQTSERGRIKVFNQIQLNGKNERKIMKLSMSVHPARLKDAKFICSLLKSNLNVKSLKLSIYLQEFNYRGRKREQALQFVHLHTFYLLTSWKASSLIEYEMREEKSNIMFKSIKKSCVLRAS